jgi:hypothetical protein
LGIPTEGDEAEQETPEFVVIEAMPGQLAKITF